MVLNVRQRQRDAIFRMLNFNELPAKRRDTETNAVPYKLLILDDFSMSIIAPLIGLKELRQKGGVTLHLNISSVREPIPDVPAVYFVQPTPANIEYILKDAENLLYDCLHINFTSHIERPLLDQLAEGAVKRSCAQQIAKVYDQYLSYISLESNLFSLGLPNTYLELNSPLAKDYDIQASSAAVVEGLFSALASMACVPVIRCPKGGAAEHIAVQLEQRIREHLRTRNSLFNEGSAGLAPGLHRPLLCLFDRNFELSVIVQHTWTYKPLVHDTLHMQLNRISLESAPNDGPSLQGPQKKSYEVGDGDFLWESYGRAQFPQMAEALQSQINQYKTDIEEINLQTGSHIDPNNVVGDEAQFNTKGLMNAMSRLPQLTEKKRNLDKHTDLMTNLMTEIKKRVLDQLYNTEEDLVQGKSDLAAIEKLLQRPQSHALDGLRLALVYLLTTHTLPSDSEFARLESAVGSQDTTHLAALRYVRKMRRNRLTGKAAPAASQSGVSANPLFNWTATTFGQGVTTLARGMNKILAGEQQAAVTVAVEGLMEAKNVPELESFASFDPKAPQGRTAPASGSTYKEAIVFIVGGGNYLEAESLATWASKTSPAKNIVYGATELLNGEAFAKQLAQLGKLSGDA